MQKYKHDSKIDYDEDASFYLPPPPAYTDRRLEKDIFSATLLERRKRKKRRKILICGFIFGLILVIAVLICIFALINSGSNIEENPNLSFPLTNNNTSNTHQIYDQENLNYNEATNEGLQSIQEIFNTTQDPIPQIIPVSSLVDSIYFFEELLKISSGFNVAKMQKSDCPIFKYKSINATSRNSERYRLDRIESPRLLYKNTTVYHFYDNLLADLFYHTCNIDLSEDKHIRFNEGQVTQYEESSILHYALKQYENHKSIKKDADVFILHTVIECVLYNFTQMNTSSQVHLDDVFLHDLKLAMEAGSQSEAFGFFNKYGTHYYTRGQLGTQLHILMDVDIGNIKDKYSSRYYSAVHACVQNEFIKFMNGTSKLVNRFCLPFMETIDDEIFQPRQSKSIRVFYSHHDISLPRRLSYLTLDSLSSLTKALEGLVKDDQSELIHYHLESISKIISLNTWRLSSAVIEKFSTHLKDYENSGQIIVKNAPRNYLSCRLRNEFDYQKKNYDFTSLAHIVVDYVKSNIGLHIITACLMQNNTLQLNMLDEDPEYENLLDWSLYPYNTDTIEFDLADEFFYIQLNNSIIIQKRIDRSLNINARNKLLAKVAFPIGFYLHEDIGFSYDNLRALDSASFANNFNFTANTFLIVQFVPTEKFYQEQTANNEEEMINIVSMRFVNENGQSRTILNDDIIQEMKFTHVPYFSEPVVPISAVCDKFIITSRTSSSLYIKNKQCYTISLPIPMKEFIGIKLYSFSTIQAPYYKNVASHHLGPSPRLIFFLRLFSKK